jgi:PAS domain S-box-containing protein
MEAIYGLPPGGLAARGGDWKPLVHRDDRAALDELLQHAQVTGEPVEGQWRVVWPDASVHWVLGRFQVTFDAADQPARVSGVNIDITERHLAEEAMKASLAEKEVLLQEIHHRVKNNLQTVSSLLQLQQREVQEPALRAVFAEADSRVRAMALVHEQLYQRELLSELDFGHYLRCLVEQLLHSGAAELSLSLELELQPLLLPVDAAIPLALITSELLTNALKYAYRDRGGGMLRIVLKSAGPAQLVLEVADDGPGLPEGFDPMAAHSLGLRLVQMLALQLDAEVQFARASGESGASCRITAPLAWTMAAHAAQVPA